MGSDNKRLILATNNYNKVEEIKSIFSDVNIDIFTLKDLSINIDPEETGKTFEENSYIKAKTIHDFMISKNILEDNDIIIADDSGFCIDFLNGEPGIMSSRYLGDDVSYKEKFDYILDKMKNISMEKRTCFFTTCICMIYKNNTKYFVGRLDGKVSMEIKGNEGFGYDPIFYIDEYNDTLASLGHDIKNKISHRRRALDKLYDYIMKIYG